MNRHRYPPALLGIFITLILSIVSPALASRAESAPALPEKAYIKGLSSRPQRFSLSCESRAASDWAAYWGVSIPEARFLRRLPRSDNPDAGFVGDPNDSWGSIPPASYGVHAPPVADLLTQYGLQAEARRDLTWDDLRSEIAAGHPVIIWVIGQMLPGTPVKYLAEDGETVIVSPFEHSMVLIGYTARTVTVLDAYSGMEKTFSLDDFLTSWETLGNMAVTGGGQLDEIAGPPPVTNPDVYTVQPGDDIYSLAAKLGLAWQRLVLWNRLPFPFALQEGQTLSLLEPEPFASWPSTLEPVSRPALQPPEAAAHALYLALIVR